MVQPNLSPISAAAASAEPEIDSIIAALRDMAAKGKLPSERILASQLDVKRHRLRQALGLLRASGELAPARLRQPAPDLRGHDALARDTNPIEVIEMRIALEPSIARSAALR